MKLLLTTATVLAGLSTSAFAGGMAEPAMVPAPVVPMAPLAPMADDWTGFYGGFQLSTGDVETGGTSLDADGYGLHAGYRYDMGSYVLAAEVDADRLDIDTLPDDATVLRLKGIAGYDAGSFMPYVTAGFANLSVDIGDDDLSDSGTFYGLGATYAASDLIDVTVEYLEHQFDDYEVLGDTDASTTSLRVSFNF